jgi:hypothetical protein
MPLKKSPVQNVNKYMKNEKFFLKTEYAMEATLIKLVQNRGRLASRYKGKISTSEIGRQDVFVSHRQVTVTNPTTRRQVNLKITSWDL